jgi:CRP-like cAMP-binding protein
MRTILSFCQGLPLTSFAPGEILMAEGGKSGILYILLTGDVEIWKGDFQVSTVAEPGAIFGEISVLLDIPHTATVKALTPCQAYMVENASAFLQSHRDITYQLARLLAQRLNGTTTSLADLKRQ